MFDRARGLFLTGVRGKVCTGSRAVDSSCVILERGWLLVVLYDGFQVSGSLLIAEVRGQGQTTSIKEMCKDRHQEEQIDKTLSLSPSLSLCGRRTKTSIHQIKKR